MIVGMMQETKVNLNSCLESEHYIWFFSSSVDIKDYEAFQKYRKDGLKAPAHVWRRAQESLGVGIMIRRDFVQSIVDVVPSSSRVCHIVLRSTVNIAFVSCLAPHAEHADETKDTFYRSLGETWSGIPSHYFKILNGDFNARLGQLVGDESNICGRWVLPASNGQFESLSKHVWNNRQRFVEFCLANDLWIQNASFEKTRKQLCTFKHATTKIGVHPWEFGKFEQIDVCLSGQRWKKLYHGRIF